MTSYFRISTTCSRGVPTNKKIIGIAWALAMVLLVVIGIGYRLMATRMNVIVTTPVKLDVPLSQFPMRIGQWVGRDVPISETVLEVAANDDFLSRLYVNESNNQWANVYIAYTARPRTMLGHRPQVCYPANGWIHENTEHAQVISNSGRKIRCLLHNFQKSTSETEQIVVLNYYIVNGQLTDDESIFSGLDWRTPNVDGNPARYVAQIQISSLLEMSVRSAAKDFTDLVLDFFPDENATVKAEIRGQKSEIRKENDERFQGNASYMDKKAYDNLIADIQEIKKMLSSYIVKIGS